ncbi:hypothetical protein KSP40_PGU022750 [Platanthera guangdongensis]|uniref:Uncharacterized protein n=1 Tax=Platanthera guangdongensis TaxID=2320717 RepID=A0ABR2MUQ4_9ASPA
MEWVCSNFGSSVLHQSKNLTDSPFLGSSLLHLFLSCLCFQGFQQVRAPFGYF